MKNLVGENIKANYFRGKEAVGGKIDFDDTGFTFRSHAMNVQTGETRIEYANILSINKRNTLGVVPNGICVTTNDNFEHKFVVNQRESVIEFLQSRLSV